MGHNIEKDEAYMWATMVKYIEKKAEAVTSVAGDFEVQGPNIGRLFAFY